ncbi:MAG: CDF family Co(II)/Ni(II) efflux transporter DmeF [Bdellovibrionales bacterium]|nr:CDF family Co(II)/Ni(II) efflux transporter DmeF [Bdellovibrionales bacterium]
MQNYPDCDYNFYLQASSLQRNKKKTSLVLWLTVVTMVIEIAAGAITGSMALMADGWHMATHAAALFIAFITYYLATSKKVANNLNFGGGKIIPLGGYTSALFLLVMVFWIAYESFERLLNPIEVHYREALFVAIVGLVVNLVSAFILGHDHSNSHTSDEAGSFHESHSHHHGHSHSHDHNLKGAYIHVLADAVTSVGAIMALLLAPYFQWPWLDPMMGLVGSLVILWWAIGLLKATSWELLDGHALSIDYNQVKHQLLDLGADVVDLHIWKIAPDAHAAEIVLIDHKNLGSLHYKKLIKHNFPIDHVGIDISSPPGSSESPHL